MTRDNIAICGYPRSGSTLLYNMLRASVVGYRTFDREISAAGLRERGPWISKDPTDRRHPDLPVERIITVRDARDVLCSVHASHPDRYKVSWDRTIAGKRGQQIVRNEGLLEIDRQCQAIDGVVVYYETLCRDPLAVQRTLGDALGLEFDRPFTRWTEAETPPGLEKQLNGKRQVSTDRIGAWQSFPERILRQFTECPALHDVLERHGYEGGRSWLDTL